MNILEIKNLYKSFDNKEIIKDVSFSVGEGKIVGLLGKNGCGKTTILKMITNLLTVDSGEVVICGQKVSSKTNSLVSFLPAYNDLSTIYGCRPDFDTGCPVVVGGFGGIGFVKVIVIIAVLVPCG